MKLELSGISKYYGKVAALENVSFTLDSGGVYGFIGPNGAGKSTLLRILAGLIEADGGDALLDGVSMLDYPDRLRRRIGFMPDTLPDAADIQVGEYLDFHLRAFGGDPERRRADMARVSEITRLDGPMLKKRLSELSKGMKQRVSLARILLHDPELLLLDEPAAGLDPGARIELRNIILAEKERGKTIIISSHILSELEDMSDGVIIIEKGRLLKAERFHTPGAAGAAPELPPEEEVVLSIVSGTAPEAWLERISAIEGVLDAVSAAGGRDIAVTLKSADFPEVMTAVIRSGFPLAAMRRSACRVDLEKVFLDNTTGKVQ